MKIARVAAYSVSPRVMLDLLPRKIESRQGFGLVEIETDEGHVGWGLTGITDTEVVARAVERVVAPALVGQDPLMIEALWDKLYWSLLPRGQTGVGAHAIAAADIALWDIKGKALGQPVWKLLGGARARVPLYATFGFHFYDRDELCEAARLWVKRGYTKLKMTVADGALRARDRTPMARALKEDIARVKAVRDAVGEGVELYVDANCNMDFYHAVDLARAIAPYDISFLEEPLTQNDARQMAELRRAVPIKLACGQNEGLAFRFRDLLMEQAVDVVQPNVCITGGFTQSAKIAGMAAAFNVPFANGGGWPYHNMHLVGGLANGTLVEFHYMATEANKAVYKDLPEPKDGWLDLPTAPGLGFDVDRDKLKDLVKA
jgi:L-rhamnonate dehydratase